MKSNLISLIAMVALFCTAPMVSQGHMVTNQKITLLEAIEKISKEYEVYFTFDMTLVADVHVEYEHSAFDSAEEAIANILKGTDLKYKFYDQRFVILYQEDAEGLESLKQMSRHLEGLISEGEKTVASAPRKTVRTIPRLSSRSSSRTLTPIAFSVEGKIIDQEGEPLIGVNIQVKGTNKGTSTDFDGNFTLEDIDENAILVVSYIGYQTQEVSTAGKSTLTITMVSDLQLLDEVVVVGYGTQKKSDLTGAVVSISSSDIEKRNATNISQILHGSIAGLDASLNTSAKETGNLLIRGKTSLKADNSPLIVVDGMIYDGDISNINTTDIQSIDILKDASSAAVYGARAASGVIIITTKKGTKGKPKINFNTSVGFSSLQRIQEAKDLDGYLKMRTDYWETNRTEQPEAYYRNPNSLPQNISVEQWRAYDGDTPLTDMELFFSRNKFNNTEYKNFIDGKTLDWYDLVFRTGVRQNYNVGISGATDNNSYYFSLGYVNNEGFVIDDNFKTLRLRSNLESNITDYLKIGINTQFSRKDESAPSPDIFSGLGQGIVGSSPLGEIYNDDGTYKLYPAGPDGEVNPFYYNYTDKYDKGNELLGNIFADVKLPWGFGYRLNWINNINWNSDYFFSYTTAERTGNGGSRNEYNSHKWYVDNIISWGKSISDIHRFDFTFLYNVEKAKSWRSNSSNTNFEPSEILGLHQLSFGLNPKISSDDVIFTADALMARMNYSLLDKYLFTAAFRRDGYSVFGTENPWANFPSGAFAWRLSEEKFFNISWIDNLKIRLSYGINGNRDISTYQALALFQPYKYIYQTESGKQTAAGYFSSRMANRNLKWEQTEAFNFGIDFSIMKGRLFGTVESYLMSTTNLILDRSLPAVTGYGAITTNLGEVQNKGFEVTLNSNNITKGKFSWDSQLIFYLNRNKIKHLYGKLVDEVNSEGEVIGQKEANDYSNNWFIDEDIDVIYNYELNGIWQLNNKEEASKFGLTPGDFKIVDQNGDGKISPREDKKFLGYSSPRYKMSFVNSFTLFKNFDVSFVLYARLGHYGPNDRGHIFGGTYGYIYSRFNQYDYPYWTPDKPNNEYSRLDTNNPYGASYFVDQSFVKLQNFYVSYTVPSQVLQPYRIQGMRLSVDLQNAFTLTSWDLWDPETNVPTPMIGTFNLSITL